MIKNSLESFFWGIIAALGALIIELTIFAGYSALSAQPDGISFFMQLFSIPQFIIVGACIEEIFKYIVISKRIDMFSMQRSYIINSFLVGLGFFSVELGLIFMAGIVPAQVNLLLEIAIIHIGTAGMIGYIVATKNPKKISTFFHAIALATFFHSVYNLLVANRTFMINYIVFALLAMIIIINLINLVRINNES